jgi:hypothetical protein
VWAPVGMLTYTPQYVVTPTVRIAEHSALTVVCDFHAHPVTASAGINPAASISRPSLMPVMVPASVA